MIFSCDAFSQDSLKFELDEKSLSMPMYKVSKLIAASAASFSLKNEQRTIAIHFIDHSGVNSLLTQLGPGGSQTLSLHFENIRGNDLLPVIAVYLGSDEEEKNYVGSMALYGLGESSEDSGQHKVFDVTRLFTGLYRQPGWSEKQFNVRLVPDRPLPEDAHLTIERITLYYHQS